MWVGLLIFYVTNVTNETNVIKVHFVGFSNSLFRAKAVPLHRISKRAETTQTTQTTKTTKITKNYANNENEYKPL